MKNRIVFTSKINFFILVLSISILFIFYISAYFTHSLDPFFDHVTMGQDFFQIPNAAFSYLHQGSLTGELPKGVYPYILCCGVNPNVYHPLFTLLIGVPLQYLSPWDAFNIWGGIHLLTSLFLGLFILTKFKENKLKYIAILFMYANAYSYYEIQHAQYHFLLNFAIFMMLYFIDKKSYYFGGLFYFLSLLVKPIGILWIPGFLVNKKTKALLIGLLLFSLFTIPFYFFPFAKYYFSNIHLISTSIIPAYNIYSISRIIPIQGEHFKMFMYFIALSIFVFQVVRKPNFFVSTFMWISFQLVFYSYVFHYHYSVLSILIPYGLLNKSFKINKVHIIPLIFNTIPTPVIFLHLMGAKAVLSDIQVAYIAIWSIFWLISLNFLLVYDNFKNSSLPLDKANNKI